MALSRFLAAGVTVAAIAAGTVSFAQDQNSKALAQAVETRHSHMHLNAFNIGVLAAMAKGEMEYDADRASAAANNLLALSKLDQTGYWLDGTEAGAVEGSRALPAIWENPEGLKERRAALTDATTQLADVAGNGLDALRGAMGPVGGACGGCHENFRQSN